MADSYGNQVGNSFSFFLLQILEGNVMNQEPDQTRKTLSDVECSLSNTLAELEEVSRKLADVRQRQKSRFGDLLIRTTLNEPIATLLQRIIDEEKDD